MLGLLQFAYDLAMRRRWALIAPLCATWLVGCAIDGADACGEHQLFSEGTDSDSAACVCDEAHGYVFDVGAGQGCKPCANGMVVRDGKCANATPADAGIDAAADAEPGSPASGTGTGTGEPCETSADCAAFEATYCDAFMSHACFIEHCAEAESTCPTGLTCCDYSSLLAGLSICLPPENLSGDECPMGGMKVEP